MARFHFVVNPLAGSGRAKTDFEIVAAELARLGIDYTAEYTQRPNQGGELARRAIDAGAECVVAVGGDGTMNEVATALCQSGVLMGILPFGTGNDMARAIPLPTAPLEALDVLLHGRERLMDAGMANDRMFINVAGIGFDVDVLQATERYKKKYNGMLPYLLGIFRALTHLRTLHMTIEADGETLHKDALIIAIGNGQYFGGGMRVVPCADPFDGIFDVCLVRKVNLLTFLLLLPGFIKGKHMQKRPVTHLRARHITVSCPEDCVLDLDGELLSQTPAAFTLLPGALRLLTQAD